MRVLPAKTQVRVAVAMAGAIFALAAAAASAAAATGQGTLQLNGAAAEALRASGVRIAPLGAADGGARQVMLPVRAGLVGSSVTVVRLGGGISFTHGRQRLKLSGLRLTLGRRATVAGKIGGENQPLFLVLEGGRREVDATHGSVRLSGLRLQLRRPVAEEIEERLRLEQRLPRAFGVLSVSKEGSAPSAPPSPGSLKPGSTGCPLPGAAGPAPEEPVAQAVRPAGAADVTGASISWDVRESFVRYINTGEGTSVFGGAVAAAPEVRAGSSTPLTYTFGFPFAGGWRDPGADPADPSDDRAVINGGGGVRFLYGAHGIDLRTSAPEIEIAGGSSRAIFEVAEGEAAPEREVIVNLDLARAASVQFGGDTVTYERVPGAIPAGAASSVFAGFYAPGTDFGCFTVSYSTAS